MSHITGSIITDCADNNARSRQQLRFSRLFGVQPTFHGVDKVAPDLEAAGNLIDQLDALTNLPKSANGTAAVVLVNVAPRGDKVREHWDNGVPFCCFKVNGILVVSTYSQLILGMVVSKGLASSVELFDIPTVTAAAVEWGEITPEQAGRINHTQFRSLEFLPLVAYWLTQKRPVPSTACSIEARNDVHGKVWAVDNFGNAKTTLVANDIAFEEGKQVKLADGSVATCYRRLADVPTAETALVLGSSGYGDERFLEVVVPWKAGGQAVSDSAAERHKLAVGSTVLAK
jgi:hypothetical protein